MMKQILFSITILIISCTTQIPITKNIRNESFPQLNEVQTQQIGISLIGQYSVEQAEFIELESIPISKGFNIPYTETKFKLQLIEKIGNKTNKFYYNENAGVVLLSNGDLKGLKISGANYYKYQVELKNQVGYKIVNEDIAAENNFAQELLYNGRSGNTLKFSYREFKNDISRPAFTQDLQYDLNESNIIGFRDLRIEVIKATNTDIEYKVISPF